MAQQNSNFVLRNRFNPLTRFFSKAEAWECIIVSTDKIYHNSVFSHWDFSVKDLNSNTYSWSDYWCIEGASKNDVKKAIYDHLIDEAVEKIPHESAYDHGLKKTTTVVTDRGKDENLAGMV
jgi:hypothetical protein